MQIFLGMVPETLKYPSAWVPLVLTALMLVVFCLYFAGIIPPDPSGDEGIGAHLFQIWTVLEFFAVAFSVLRWVAMKPKETVLILGLQILLALVPLAIVFSLHL